MKIMLLLLLGLGGLGLAAENQPAPAALAEAYEKTILSALVGLVDGKLLDASHTLDVLAQTAKVQSGQWDQMQDLLRTAAAGQPPQVLWFALPDGTYYTSDQGRVEQKLSDRPYFPKLMRGERVTGELVISKSTGKRSIIIAVPVQREGRVIGAVGASIFADDLSRNLNETLKPPAGSLFYGLAPNGYTTFHINPKLDFIDVFQQQSESLRRELKRMLAQPSGEATYEFLGTIRHVFFTTSPVTGWRIAFGRILGPASAPGSGK